MKKNWLIGLFFLLSGVTIGKDLKTYFSNLPFSMPELTKPQFPEYTVSITDYGASRDGHTLNTKAFQDAIAACAKAGGGKVIVPPGTWLTGPIQLQSHVNLHLERGALVQFSPNIQKYPFIPGLDGKSDHYMITPLISAYKAKNIAITGEGIFEGAGEVWRYVKKIDMTESQWKALVLSGGVVTPNGEQWWPSEEAMKGKDLLEQLRKTKGKLSQEDYEKTKEYLRPNMILLEACTEILLDGPTFTNSPRFHILLSECENAIVRNVKVLSPEYGQNTDGIDLRACRNVLVYNCTVDVGDDGICLKPAHIGPHQSPGPSCQNIVIADCYVYSAHGGFVIGSETYGGVKNIFVHNCIFLGTDVGLRFKSARDRGGLVKDLFFENIQMRNIKTDAILFDMDYRGNAPEMEMQKDLMIRTEAPLTNRTPRLQNFYIKNIICNGAKRAIVINGLPEMPIQNIFFENVSITSRQGILIADGENIEFNNCRIVPHIGPVGHVIESKNIRFQGGNYPRGKDVFLKVTGEKSENIRIKNVLLPEHQKAIEAASNVKPEIIIEK